MLFAMLTWWYTEGWADRVKRTGGHVRFVLESFSVSSLAGSLFEPFRQMGAGQVRGGLDTQLRAMGDRLFSRVFGAVMRSVLILLGLFGAFLTALFGLIELIIWPVVPALPVIGAILALSRWVP